MIRHLISAINQAAPLQCAEGAFKVNFFLLPLEMTEARE
jgi:hypothetical protein